MGEGLDSYVLIGVVAAGWHPGEVSSISVIPKDGTAKSGCILFICTTLHQIKIVLYNYNVQYIIHVRIQSLPTVFVNIELNVIA